MRMSIGYLEPLVLKASNVKMEKQKMIRLFTTDHGFIVESIVKFIFYIIRTSTINIEMPQSTTKHVADLRGVYMILVRVHESSLLCISIPAQVTLV